MKRIIILLILLLFVVSCSDGNTAVSTSATNFKQGVSELEAKFLPNAPPAKLFPDSTFKMILELDNQAAYEVKNGLVSLVGLDENYIQVFPLDESIDVMIGKSNVNPAGEKRFLEFEGSTSPLFKNAERYNGNYLLKVAYESNMEFTDTVCINSNLYQVYDSGCQVQNSKQFSGQGAPLLISKIEEIVTPGAGAAVEFRIFLGNRGRGKVKDVALTRARLGGTLIPCEFKSSGTNKRKMTWTNKIQEAVLVCRTPLEDQNSYTTTLALEFDYTYELEQQNRLQVVNPSK